MSHCLSLGAVIRRGFMSVAGVMMTASLAGCHSTAIAPPGYKPANRTTDCEVAMQFAHGKEIMPASKADEGGAVFPAATALHVVSDPVCVKLRGQGVRIPDQIPLYTDDGAYDHYGLCAKGSATSLENPTGAPLGATAKCRWNRQFRDTYPLSVVLYTVDGSDLSQHLRLVRIFRNGSLAYRWVSNDAIQDSALTGKHVLFIPGESLRGSLMPHEASFDIRLMGSEMDVDESVLKQEVQSRKRKAEVQIKAFLEGALSSSVFSNGMLKQDLEKLDRRAKHVLCLSHVLVDSIRKTTDPAVDIGKACPAPDGLTVSMPEGRAVQELYERLRQGGRGRIDKAEGKASDEVLALSKAMGAYADKALDEFYAKAKNYYDATNHSDWMEFLSAVEKTGKLSEFKSVASLKDVTDKANLLKIKLPKGAAGDFFEWLEMRASGATLRDILAQADKVMQEALLVVGDGEKLLDRMRDDVAKVLADEQAQERLFNDTFKALQSTSMFEQYQSNPPALKGESVLPLSYSDRFQWYLLAPWHGIAVRSEGGQLTTDFNAMTLVPIIDVLGGRVQFGRSRFGDLRFGVGAAGMMEEVDRTVADGSDEAATKQVFSLIPELNVGLANIKMGVGYAVASGGDLPHGPERLRLFIGADLFKIISAGNVEAATW